MFLRFFFMGCTFLFFQTTFSAETDQFSVWTKELLDSTEKANLFINHELNKIALKVTEESKNHSCKYFRNKVGAHFTKYRDQSKYTWRDFHHGSYPDIENSTREFALHQSIYKYSDRVRKILNLGIMNPKKILTGTIKINNTHIGIDKLAHFFLLGFDYSKLFEKKLNSKKLKKLPLNERHEKAMEEVLDWGIEDEKSKHGLWMVAFSYGDYEANFQGFQFYRDLCDSENPYFKYIENQWTQIRPFYWENYISPRLDESYYMSGYREDSWESIQKGVKEHCEEYKNNDRIQKMFTEYGKKMRANLSTLYIESKKREDRSIPPQPKIWELCKENE